MDVEAIKHAIDVAARKYKSLDPVYQKLITTLAGAGVGASVGSVSLGKDKSGKKRGYLLGGEKGDSRAIGGLVGALAGLHVPTASTSEKKAAETAAVGQPQYPTEGYTPEMGPRLGGVPIPLMTHDGYVYPDRNSAAFTLSDPVELLGHDYAPAEKALRIANPRHGAWFAAHTNALTKATQPLRDAGANGLDDIPKALSDAISKIYHDEMKRTTNAPAVKAVAPSKKPAEKKAAFDVDWSKAKGNINWNAIKQRLAEVSSECK